MTLQQELIKSFSLYSKDIAIEFAGETHTYESLFSRSNRITQFLLDQSVGKETIIGIDLSDKVELISSVIGVINAGCVFVLLDNSLPSKRYNYILDDLDLKYLITNSHALNNETKGKIEHTWYYETILTLEQSSAPFPYPDFNENDSLYICFTSGSTGEPKGIVGRNGSLLHFLQWQIHAFTIDKNIRASQLVSPYFDAFLRDIFVPLLVGGTICIPPMEDSFFSPSNLIAWLNDSQISHINCVPSLFRVFNVDRLTNEDFGNLAHIFLSAEKIIPSELENWFDIFGDRIKIVNFYGSTETTLVSSSYTISPEDVNRIRIPVGKPIDDTELWVANENLKQCSTLIPGELYIVSRFPTKGYLNKPELTKEKFIRLNGNFGEETIAYRTGDMGRKLPDGNIDLLGRADRQIKLRGIRIELEEIESYLMKSDLVENGLVILQKDETGNESLRAFVIPKSDQSGSTQLISTLSDYLKEHLPQNMVPSDIILIDAFPLLPNGKLNLKELQHYKVYEKELIHPANKIEEQILSAWKSILGNKEISTEDSFYKIGGNSLSIMSLIAKLNKEFDVKISLSELFENSTIRLQASLIEKAKKKHFIPVTKAPEAPHYTLSPAQNRLYFLYEFDSKSLAYNSPQIVKLIGKLNRQKLHLTLSKLIQRHESLRTYFVLINDEPRQKIVEDFDFNIEYFNCSHEKIEGVINSFIRPFDLNMAPLIRCGVIEIEENENILIIDLHHIISDGISGEIMLRDFMDLYNDEEIPELSLQFKDYAEWLQREDSQKMISLQKEFWLEEFSSFPEPIELPRDYLRPNKKSHEGEILNIELTQEHSKQIKHLADENDVTVYMLLLAVFNIFLSKLCNAKDITIGIPVAGRQHDDLEDIIGMFANTLPIRNSVNRDICFEEFLQSIKTKLLSCLDNQDFPFEELVDELSLERDTSRNPLFDIMFVYQNFEETHFEIPHLKLEPYPNELKIAKFDFSLVAYDQAGRISIYFEYGTKLFKRSSIERYAGYFHKIVDAILDNPSIPLKDIQILSSLEQDQLLYGFNKTIAPYPKDQTIVSLFETQVAKTPDNIAVRYEGQEMTYTHLDDLSSRLAFYLLDEWEIERGDLVGIMLEREEWLIPSIFGILKAGAAYVPIDPKYPAARKAEIISSAGLKCIITRGAFLEETCIKNSLVINLDEYAEVLKNHPIGEFTTQTGGGDLAYVMYTSGSTGKPKGVMIEHHAVLNRILWMQKAYPLKESDVLLQKTPIVFDVSVWELFWWSFVGASLSLLEPDGEKDPQSIIQAVSRDKVSTIHFVPSMLSAFFTQLGEEFDFGLLKSLRQVFSSGEALKVEHVKRFGETLNHHCGSQLINLYGPTEATVDVSHYLCDFGEQKASVPIGSPIDNIRLYILDESQELSPIGVKGELMIGGVGLARGYLGNKTLTQEKFIEHPLLKGERIYKTGDQAKWLPDGNIAFLGRKDNQVKLRGYRIELGEIEQQLLQHEEIAEGIIVLKQFGEEKSLVAYYVSQKELSSQKLRNYLAERLPGYMVPTFFVYLDEMPLTPNGKVNRKALPEVEFNREMGDGVPKSDMQKRLAEVWAEVLAVEAEKIGIHQSFFELGGHSILAIRLVGQIREHLGVEVGLPVLFNHPTIASLSEVITQERGTE
ncbi:MAG: amino acid adenylation domain-containing protein, partial [Bacteroidota bacterium]